MINSVNLEFLKPKLINMDKFNCPPATTKLLPPATLTKQSRTFVNITQQHPITDNQQQKTEFLLNHNIIKQHQLQQQQQQQQQERVKVQHLENHTILQNNKCWNNFRTLNYTSASSAVKDEIKIEENEIDVVNVEHLTKINNMETPINIQNKSAFNLDLNNKKYLNNNNNNNNNNNSIYGNNNDNKLEPNNNNYNFYNKQPQQQQYGLINIKTIKTETLTSSVTNSTQRTEDQNNAYRHIESVHNYAKSKSYEDEDDDNHSPNGSRQSSYLDDEEEDEEDDDDEDEEAEYNDADYDEHLGTNLDDLDADYEDIFQRRKNRRFQKLSTSSDGALLIKYNNNNKLKTIDELRKTAQFVSVNKAQQMPPCSNINNINIKQEEEEEIHIDVDVETVESQSSPNLAVGGTGSLRFNGVEEESATAVKPDHHARRPMNAFLIFCKRHRAIVKERYKNLENRAITKILGDWWASLDANDKKCFTNLAQQNKDAFFSANPNFKWYKLPAPPLRNLNTRPAFGQECPDGENETQNNNQEIISNNTRSCSNYFKLADEAQMGDLSQLMQDKTKNPKQSNNDLQQALGETSQFMSAHIQSNAGDLAMEENTLKRRYHNENSFSSNSSEDDLMEPKKKSARSCKGKRYQELINSGQIATVVKKTKATGRTVGGGGHNDIMETNVKQNFSNCNSFNSNVNTTNSCQKRSISECDNLINYDINGFDLEERIKELPALNLDDYLQRKRNTKKKKKFSTNNKKRGQRLGNNNNNGMNNNNTSQSNNESNLVIKLEQTNENITQRPVNKQPTAVGSQKRKARKESITRRDVSAIEQEVASLLPLTINGCCYLQAIEKDTDTITSTATTATPQTPLNVTSTSPIIPLQQNTSTTVSIDIFNNNNNNNNNNNKNITNNNNNLNHTLNDNISSSTSDLLILAEVAANRTEL